MDLLEFPPRRERTQMAFFIERPPRNGRGDATGPRSRAYLALLVLPSGQVCGIPGVRPI